MKMYCMITGCEMPPLLCSKFEICNTSSILSLPGVNDLVTGNQKGIEFFLDVPTLPFLENSEGY